MIQKEWMTSRDCSLILTVLSTGRYYCCDGHVGLVVLRLEDRLVARGEGEEADHEDERDDRVEDLDRHVVAELDGQTHLALATPVGDRRPSHQTPGDDTDDQQHDPRVHPQAGDHVGVVGGRLAVFSEPGEEAVQLGRGASGEDCSRCDPERENGPADTAFRRHGAPFRSRTGLSPV